MKMISSAMHLQSFRFLNSQKKRNESLYNSQKTSVKFSSKLIYHCELERVLYSNVSKLCKMCEAIKNQSMV